MEVVSSLASMRDIRDRSREKEVEDFVNVIENLSCGYRDSTEIMPRQIYLGSRRFSFFIIHWSLKSLEGFGKIINWKMFLMT